MKRVILISGTMGIGKTTICQQLKLSLKNTVFLDGDWCWDMHPFIVNEETKRMVMNNIIYQLNQFLHCSHIENIIFGWVMHEQSIIDEIVNRIDKEDTHLYTISLVCSEEHLRKNIEKDIAIGLRKKESLQRSLERLPMYSLLKTQHIDVTDKSVQDIVEQVKSMIG